ncbi:MAG: molybdenum cofactor biosynthesis protein B [Alphaproteobacteria bacterium]|nr:molybdenum cofactor biosynthesis protein B [Alphaproteobacteria bacterium SS10]
MAGIDENATFIPLNIAVLTVSDTRTEADDTSGALLIEKLTAAGHKLAERRIVPDDRRRLGLAFEQYASDDQVDIVISTGGTGLTGRDVTPEALRDVMDKEIEGFGELFRQLSYDIIGTSTIQSRAMAALVKTTYVFCLPGSTSACKDAWDGILSTQLDSRYKPCNFIELIPRLNEREPA